MPVKPPDVDIKSAISGNIKLASFYKDGLVTVRVATDKTHIDSGLRAQALQAARLVQQGVRLSCGKLCKPGPMASPTLLANLTLGFDLVLRGYAGILSTADMVNLVSAKLISPAAKPVVAPAAPAAAALAPVFVALTGATRLQSTAGPASALGMEPPDSRLPATALGKAH